MEVRLKVMDNLAPVLLHKFKFELGLGLHLKKLTTKLPPWNNLHEPRWALTSQSEYEHLHCIFWLCHVHIHRKIKQAAVPDPVKNKMHSLICIEHEDFEGCLQDIASSPTHRLGAGQNLQPVCITGNVLATKLHTKAHMAGRQLNN
jgi:hypothetical protein